jgi:hypothetical protein
MKSILMCAASLALAMTGAGCKKGGGAGDCAAAITKGVDAMTASGADRMKAAPPEMQAKMTEATAKLKGVITNRCTEDKWPAEVIDCYGAAQKREDLRACRAKLPAESAAKLQKEEMDVMMGAGFGGMRGPHGPGMGMGGGSGMGGPDHPDTLQGSGVPPAPPAQGTATAPPPPAMGSAAAGSAK